MLLGPGRPARGHRVIWKMVNKRDPGLAEIDHKDGDKRNNKDTNLRKAKRWQQTVNSRKNPRNTSGFRGVYQRPSGRWCAQIRANRETQLLGTFDTREEAAAAYKGAAALLHGAFVREKAL